MEPKTIEFYAVEAAEDHVRFEENYMPDLEDPQMEPITIPRAVLSEIGWKDGMLLHLSFEAVEYVRPKHVTLVIDSNIPD